jgi:hypothetical protein
MFFPVHKASRRGRHVLIAVIFALMVTATPLAAAMPGADDGGVGGGPGPSRTGAMLVPVDSVSALVEVPPQDTRVLRIDHETASLVPIEWYDPLDALSPLHDRAVDRVEDWLKRDLAVQLNRMGSDGNRFAQHIVDCSEEDWVDEIAFTVAHTPPEVLTSIGNVNVLTDNVRQLYAQDADISYADIVERTGEDGDYSTVSYINYTGMRHEYPRDIYYWYIAHARVFWEDPARVAGKSFWRKAYWEEITYDDSGTLKSWVQDATNIIEGANASTVWMQMNMEFGYGTNPLQPVQVILERYGSCGQYSITTASSLKAAMIPARVCIYPASDHQWCEVYIDGSWMHVDASNDVAGRANVKEPELIRRTKSVNFNDAGVFERGWKPYMSATSTFRSDDVIMNTIDISAPDPSFSFKETGLVERTGAEPHIYTDTSTVTITVLDSGGVDPIEGAYVGVYRVGHDIYNPDTPDYPHFANANYTNATGQVEFLLGEQGYCGRCDDDHYYAALILSRYNGGTNDFYAFSVPEVDQEYSFTYTVTGDAPVQEERGWTLVPDIWAPPTTPGDFQLNISFEAWGRQRHTHGEWGQAEMFNFRTSFDHVFPSDVDLMVVDSGQLLEYYSGSVPEAWMGATDADTFTGSRFVPHDEDLFILLSNLDSHYTTKVVDLTVDLSAMCKPKLSLVTPDTGIDHNTAEPLVFSGTVWDHVPITGLDVSLDGGDSWVDLYMGHDAANRTFQTGVDVSALDSGSHNLILRALNSVGVENRVLLTVFLDADDPVSHVVTPSDGSTFNTVDAIIGVTVNASDNRVVDKVQTRLEDGGWVDLETVEWEGCTHFVEVSMDGAVGDVELQVRTIDGVGRSSMVTISLFLDAIDPMLELRGPEHRETIVVGPEQRLTVSGTTWDDHGIGELRYWIDYTDGSEEGIDITSIIEEDGTFIFTLDVTDWDEGEHLVTVWLWDLSGRDHWREFTVVKDASAPMLVIDELDPYFNDRQDVKLNGRATDDNDMGGVWVAVDGGDEVELTQDIAGGFTMSLPSRDEAVGEHTVRVRVADIFGNAVTQTLDYQVVDETDPLLALYSPTNGAAIGRGAIIHVTGEDDDNVGIISFTLQVGRYETIVYPAPDKGPFDISIDTADMDLGQLLLEAWVEDAAGNVAEESVVVFIVDRSDPAIDLAVDPLKAPKVEKGKEVLVPAAFTDDVAVTKVEYRIDGWTWIQVPCEFPCESWDIMVPTGELSPGSHVLEVRVTDAAGNDAMVSTPFQVTAVPDESSTPIGMILGVLVAAVVAIVLVYFLVLGKGREAVPEQEDEVEPEHEPEPGDEADEGNGPPEQEPEDGPAE